MYIDPSYWQVNMETDSHGSIYCAGIGMGIPQPEQPKPFIVVDGVVYINSALIEQATIKVK